MKNLYALLAYKNGAIIHKQFQEANEDDQILQAAANLRNQNESDLDSVVVTKFNEDTLSFDYLGTMNKEESA